MMVKGIFSDEALFVTTCTFAELHNHVANALDEQTGEMINHEVLSIQELRDFLIDNTIDDAVEEQDWQTLANAAIWIHTLEAMADGN